MKKAKDMNNDRTEHRLIRNRLDVIHTKTSDKSNEKVRGFLFSKKHKAT